MLTQCAQDIYFTSKTSNIDGDLDWQISLYGKPNTTGGSESQVYMIAVDKSELIAPGTVGAEIPFIPVGREKLTLDIADIFYFYWYSFNR